MRAFTTLLKIELKLVLRSLDMVIFAIVMPVVVLVVVGLIYGSPENGSTIVQMTMGAYLSIGVCAAGLMGLPLTLAEYRNRKVLKRMSVTPVHPATLLGVQVIAQAVVALLSAVVVAATGALFFGYEMSAPVLRVLAAYLLVMVSVFSIGLVIAGTARDIKRAGMVASLVYFPMLIFSGTTVPFTVFPEFIQRVAVVLPLRHGIQVLDGALYGKPMAELLPSLLILVAIAIAGSVTSLRAFSWEM